MKKILFILPAIVLLTGCGASKLASPQEQVDKKWNEYKNQALGISLRFPRVAYHRNWNSPDGGQPAPIQLVEEGEVISFIVGTSTKGTYVHHPYYSTDYQNDSDYPDQIYLAKVTSTEGLKAFMTRTYGRGCALGGPSTYDDRPGVETYTLLNAPNKKCQNYYPVGDAITWSPSKGVAVGIQTNSQNPVSFDKPNPDVVNQVIIEGMSSK